jgi:DNA-binding GntR family transcriptional regulator
VVDDDVPRDGTTARRLTVGGQVQDAKVSKHLAGFGKTRIEPSSSLRDQVEAAIAASITSGEIAPDAVISVPTLAVQFNVSATPVREAMLNLEKRGFVEAMRNRGFRVTSVSRQDLEEIVAVRQLLEPRSMAELASSFDTSKVAQFRQLANSIVAGAQVADLRSYLESDAEFHLSLLQELGNRHLLEIVRDLRSQTRLLGLVALIETEELMQSAQEHHQLLDFLLVGDSSGAEELMTRHIRHILGWWAGEPEPKNATGGDRPNTATT